jgi:hypothetical protein
VICGTGIPMACSRRNQNFAPGEPRLKENITAETVLPGIVTAKVVSRFRRVCVSVKL